VGVKAGTAATTGTQTTPTPDAGYIPLWVVTVPYGDTSVDAGQIVAAPGAPAISIGGGGGGGGSALPAWQFLSTNYNLNAVAKDRIAFDTTAGVLIATLPAAPSVGDECWVAGNFGTNKLTIARNGKTIAGSATDFDITVNNAGMHLVYRGSNDWLVFKG
jgi:hypothetical protein